MRPVRMAPKGLPQSGISRVRVGAAHVTTDSRSVVESYLAGSWAANRGLP